MSLQYYMPDWDDRVDPRYNFLTDEHASGRQPYRDDFYAHQIYNPAPYDGVLLSRTVIEENSTKHKAIQAAGSVHRYLRLPEDGMHTVLGDCGAFSYWKEYEPPYKAPDMLEYYQTLGFDFGVSIDHLIFAELENEKERRWNLTVHNAEEFLRLHREQRYTFTPIGVAQGWNPESYRRAVHHLIKMGYEYIALGGLVRSTTTEVLKVIAAVQEELQPKTRVHLFGVSRPEYIQTFARLGVTSFDSASRLRRAWMDGRRNYFLGDAAYTAIRIPVARVLAKETQQAEEDVLRKEQLLLNLLRAYDKDETLLRDVYEASIDYARISGKDTARTRQDYLQTLEERPWKRCECRICQDVGVEVIIFRGNNRNRRRGFHNTWQLYQQLQQGRMIEAPAATLLKQIEMPIQ